MKKLIPLFCLLLCSIAMHAEVQTGSCGENLTWQYDTDTKALTITGTGEMYPNAFYEWSNLASVTISDGVTSIGAHAFDGCSSLTSVVLPPTFSKIHINDNAIYFVNTNHWNWTNVYVYAWSDTTAIAAWPGVKTQKADFTYQGYDVYYFEPQSGEYANCIFNNGRIGSDKSN